MSEWLRVNVLFLTSAMSQTPVVSQQTRNSAMMKVLVTYPYGVCRIAAVRIMCGFDFRRMMVTLVSAFGVIINPQL